MLVKTSILLSKSPNIKSMTQPPEINIDPKEAVLYAYCLDKARNDEDYVVKTSDEIRHEGTYRFATKITEGHKFVAHRIFEGNHFYIYRICKPEPMNETDAARQEHYQKILNRK